MNAAPTTGGFSLRSLMLWMCMLSLSFGLFWWNARVDLPFLFWAGIGSLCLAAILAWVALQRSWKLTTSVVLVLLAVYVGVYLTLTVRGRYEPAVYGLDHIKSCMWVPAGFVNGERWNMPLVYAYLPLWRLDRWYWHESVRPDYSGPYSIDLSARSH